LLSDDGWGSLVVARLGARARPGLALLRGLPNPVRKPLAQLGRGVEPMLTPFATWLVNGLR
jgi:hypothetical protein